MMICDLNEELGRKGRDVSFYAALPREFNLVETFKGIEDTKFKQKMVVKEAANSFSHDCAAREFYKFEGIQINSDNFIKLIAADIDYDYEEALKKCEQLDILPNFIIKNKYNNKAHFVFLVKNWINKKSQPAAIKFYDFVKKALSHAIDADPHYKHLHIKNPWNEEKYVILALKTPQHSVRTIYDKLPQAAKDAVWQLKRYNYIPPEKVEVGSRNNSLHQSMILTAWTLKKTEQFTQKDAFSESIIQCCHEYNNRIAKPLSKNEVESVASSITEYVWKNEIPKSIANKGIMKALFPQNCPLATKQTLSGTRSSKLKAERTFQELNAIYPLYASQAKKLTRFGLCKYSGKAYDTVLKYWDKIIDPNIHSLQNDFELVIPVSNYISNFKPITKKKGKEEYLINQYAIYLRDSIGKATNKSAFSKFAKVDVQTVRAHWAALEEVKNRVSGK